MELILTIAAGVVLGGLTLIHRAWLMDKMMLLLSLVMGAITGLARWLWAIRMWIITAVVLLGIALGVALTAAEDSWDRWKANRSFAPYLRQACADAGLTYWMDSRDSYYCAEGQPDGEADVSIMYFRDKCVLFKFVDGYESVELGNLGACLRTNRWYRPGPDLVIFEESQINLGDIPIATADPALPGSAAPFEQSYESCALSAWEVFLAAKKYSTGQPIESLTNGHPNPHNIEATYRLAKEEGVKVPYMVGHLKYKQCAGELDAARTAAPPTPWVSRYYRCAQESALRTNILVRFDKKVPIEVAMRELPEAFDIPIYELYGIAERQGIVAALEESATRLDSCIGSAKGD